MPGTVRGLDLAHKKFGKLPWKDVVAAGGRSWPRRASPSTPRWRRSLNCVLSDTPTTNAEFRRVYGKDGGAEAGRPATGSCSRTWPRRCGRSPRRGRTRFYTGEIGRAARSEMKAGGGLITKADLAAYRAKERKPIHGTYRGYDVYGPPPPSSGGICLVEMLNILENFDLKKHGRCSPRDAAPDGRGDAAGLLRPRPPPRRPGLRQRSPTT